MSLLKPAPFPTMTTSRLLLACPSVKDAADYHEILSSPDISRYSDIPHQPTKKRSERFVSWMSKLHPRRTGVGWIIKLRTSKLTIGSIRINSIEKKASCGLIGYELHPDHWGNGYATEALGAVVEYAHKKLSLNRLEAWATVDNIASGKVLLNNGFLHEGTQRSKARFRNEFWDIHLYGRLAIDNPDNQQGD